MYLFIVRYDQTATPGGIEKIWLVVNGATRNTQCATDNLSVILWGLWNAMQGDDLILRGGGLSNFVWTDNLFSAWARENLFLCDMGSGKFIFM